MISAVLGLIELLMTVTTLLASIPIGAFWVGTAAYVVLLLGCLMKGSWTPSKSLFPNKNKTAALFRRRLLCMINLKSKSAYFSTFMIPFMRIQ